MTNFEFNTGVPNEDNNPSVDQPDMLINTNSENSIWTIDHISYNSNNGGNHLQTGFPDFRVPVLPSDGGANHPSVAYPAAGVADVNNPQYYFKNAVSNFLLSGMRAFALCASGGGTIGGQLINVVSNTRNSLGNYTITLTANTTASSNYLVFIQPLSSATSIISSVVITSATVFTVKFIFSNGLTPAFNFIDTNFAVMVVQI